ncbi:acetyl esterase/lipase [Streptomyces phaeochromogenes]|jgi:acetyl esterase/lipase|uniref:alpha/beta hydrolase fold domain-containing protein n=1 Tax=Streptomyces phaeochromogenes TaxID=1923 RepID=UPI002792734A|nr:alpha/beta hydrolase fold domain-containing protein [Streptomyces phaeochromogenes]MDQ0952912.1 acetyl esterase/lipase [Streptomyces phaeochromogenes]
MSFLARPAMASLAARAMQRLTALADRRIASSLLGRYPECPRNTRELSIPTSVGPARAVVYLPDVAIDSASGSTPVPPVHVNFHGGGYVLPPIELDDPLCRFLAAEAGVAVVNVDYVVAPQYPFPAPPHQAYEIVRWVAGHGAEHGWDGDRLTVGGQSAGGGLAAAVARQALEARDDTAPSIALQVLHYPPLDLATHARDKRAAIAKPVLRPWMADVFDSAYVPDPRRRADPLVSPAHPSDTADLTGIAPAFVVTAEHDLLRAEGVRYAERLRKAGALLDHYDVPGVDHGYDQRDAETARGVYALIAAHVRRATTPGSGNTPRENQP